MSKMMAYDPELGEWLEQRLSEWGYPAECKHMFGHQSWFLNGYMFTGANELGIFVHLGEDAVQTALGDSASAGDVASFEPGPGMTMKDYLVVTKQVCSDETTLRRWLAQSSDYLVSLPPKQPKKRKKKSAG